MQEYSLQLAIKFSWGINQKQKKPHLNKYVYYASLNQEEYQR